MVWYIGYIRLKSTLRGNADMFSQQMRSLLTVICSLVLSVSILEWGWWGQFSVSLALAGIYVYIGSIHIAAVLGGEGAEECGNTISWKLP